MRHHGTRANWCKTRSAKHVFNSFIENKKIEWENVPQPQVTDYETEHYLPVKL